MRLTDYILSALSQFGIPVIKFGGFLSSLAGAIKAFFNWRAKIEERQRSGFWNPADEKSRFNLIGWSLATIGVLVFTGYWIYQDYLNNQKTPEAVVESYYNNIRIGSYQKAWSMIDPEIRQQLFPGGLSKFEAKWKAYNGIEIHKINSDKGARVAALVFVVLHLSERRSGRKLDMDVQHSVSRSEGDSQWLIIGCVESQLYAHKEE